MKKVKQILSLFLCISVLISGFIPVYAEASQKATKDENVFLILNADGSIQDQIVSFVTKHSKISKQRFLDYMMATDEIATDVGTVVYGPETVESGLMDQLGSLSDAFSWLHRQIAKEKKKK